MRSLTSIGLGLSLTFACLLLALVAEIYYLLWWKRRSWNSGITQHDCCTTTITTTQSLTVTHMLHQTQNQTSLKDDLQVLKSDNGAGNEDGSLQFHPITGPHRLLCTIKEETREDMESEEGSFSDSMLQPHTETETPYLTPLTSPSLLTPLSSPYTHLGFNPLFESSTDAELSRLKTSPPPTFKFLQKAEAKFQTRRMMMVEEGTDKDHSNNEGGHPDRSKKVERDESFIAIIVAQGGTRGHRG